MPTVPLAPKPQPRLSPLFIHPCSTRTSPAFLFLTSYRPTEYAVQTMILTLLYMVLWSLLVFSPRLWTWRGKAGIAPYSSLHLSLNTIKICWINVCEDMCVLHLSSFSVWIICTMSYLWCCIHPENPEEPVATCCLCQTVVSGISPTLYRKCKRDLHSPSALLSLGKGLLVYFIHHLATMAVLSPAFRSRGFQAVKGRVISSAVIS